MNKKNTIIALISTLLIGFIFGFFLSGRLAKSRMDKVRNRMEQPNAEQQFLSRKLNLTTEQQKVIIPLLDSMLPIQNRLRKKHKKEMIGERNSMFQELKKNLTEDQKLALDKMQKRRKKNRPPHPRR